MATTAKSIKGWGKRRKIKNFAEATLLRHACNARIKHLNDVISKCAGSMWPIIHQGEINEIAALFEALTGYPLEDEYHQRIEAIRKARDESRPKHHH